MPPLPWVLVSPASRGIGFALTRRILQTTKAPVMATARHDLEDVKKRLLQDLPGCEDGEKRLKILKVDVTDESSIEAAANTCSKKFPHDQGHQLQLAMTVPGILRAEKSPVQIKSDDVMETYRVNVLGPMLLMKHFHDFLPRKTRATASSSSEPPSFTSAEPLSSKEDQEATRMMEGLPPYAVWAIMSARVGSITDNSTVGGWYSYRSSKAAVNQLVKTFDLHLRTRAGGNAACLGMHPGTVKTDLSRDYWASTRDEKLFSPEFSAGRLVDLCCGRLGVGIDGRGRCWDWDGKEIQP